MHPVVAVVAIIYALFPVKAYTHVDEGINVRFGTAQTVEAQNSLDASLKAGDLLGGFVAPAAGDIIDDSGKPQFHLYTFDGVEIPPAAGVKADASKGVLDMAAFFPQTKDGGTYILTWKTATPLVIETLYNPGRSKQDYQEHQTEIESAPADQQAMIKAQFTPTVTHIVPLSYAVIHTDKGDIKATFWYDVAPHTVDNFIGLSRQNFYDGSAFHRVIKGFMIQGGDSLGNIEGRAGSGGPGYEIMQEFNNKPHERGVLSMARGGDPNSAGSQFFIMHKKTPSLDHKYTGFGQVLDGMDVVDKIAETPVSDDNGAVKGEKPKILKITIAAATADMYGIK